MDNKLRSKLEVGKNLMELIEFIIYKEDTDGESIPCFYGINVFKVMEVIEFPKLVPFPHKLPYLEGLFNLRDENIPLLNLIDRVDGVKKKFSECVVIVAEFNNVNIGLLVHKVKSIKRVSWNEILPSPKITNDLDTELIVGVINKEDDESLIILDFEAIVNEINDYSVEHKSKKNIDTSDIEKLAKEKTVMLVDDSKMIRKKTVGFLEEMGFNAITCNDGQEALETLIELKMEAQSEEVPVTDKIAVIITDLEMPRMDGYTLIKKIKSDDYLKAVPVIIQSSLSNENIRNKGAEVGADDYIVKFNRAHIKDVLGKALEKYK